MYWNNFINTARVREIRDKVFTDVGLQINDSIITHLDYSNEIDKCLKVIKQGD